MTTPTARELHRIRSAGKPSNSLSSRITPRDHADGGAQPVHHRGHVHRHKRATRGGRHSHTRQQLTRPGHVHAELTQNGLAIGPDGYRTAACLRIRALVEDGDVVPVAKQSREQPKCRSHPPRRPAPAAPPLLASVRVCTVTRRQRRTSAHAGAGLSRFWIRNRPRISSSTRADPRPTTARRRDGRGRPAPAASADRIGRRIRPRQQIFDL